MKIVVYHKQEKIGAYNSFREAVIAVAGSISIGTVGNNGFVFYQGNQCVGVI